MASPFKWRHHSTEIILLCVRWYLRYSLSFRDLEEMMKERELSIVHTTIYRWVQDHAPDLDKRSRPYLKKTNESWHVDETYIKVRGKWIFLYRAVDSTGQTLDFLLNEPRSTRAAKRFFRKVLGQPHIVPHRVINVDKGRAYIGAVRDLIRAGLLPERCKRRPSRYMNNVIEQDHRFVKRRILPGLGFFSYLTAWRTIRGFEAMHMIRKGQITGAEKGDLQSQNAFHRQYVQYSSVSHKTNRFALTILIEIFRVYLQHIRRLGLRQARYLGLARTHLQHTATAAAINLFRIFDWLSGRRPTGTPVPHFVALAAT